MLNKYLNPQNDLAFKEVIKVLGCLPASTPAACKEDAKNYDNPITYVKHGRLQAFISNYLIFYRLGKQELRKAPIDQRILVLYLRTS